MTDTEVVNLLGQQPMTRYELQVKLGKPQQRIAEMISRNREHIFISGWKTAPRKGQPAPVYSKKTSPEQLDFPYPGKNLQIDGFEKVSITGVMCMWVGPKTQ